MLLAAVVLCSKLLFLLLRGSIYYFLKLISATSETLVFLLLGIEVITSISQGVHSLRQQRALGRGSPASL